MNISSLAKATLLEITEVGWGVHFGRKIMGISHMDVLVVDDHPVVVSGCRMMFAQREGIEVHAAADEKSGYEAYFEKAA